MILRFRLHFIVLILLPLLVSCTGTWNALTTEKAQLGKSSANLKDLKSLPQPREKVVCAVYKFRDQTGQYKTSATGTSWSTAVTQGATSILSNALEESGWFVVIEREGLSNLLNERKIIRSSRSAYDGPEGQKLPDLPPLLYAGVILEGGIVSYDSNILTGGAGAKYFGIGASAQYRQDRVTVYLRAVSTQNGRVLKTVYTTKTLLSQMIDVGVYRFVSFKRLLEAEGGISYNEPPEICVRQAIEKAVQSLVIEGVFENLWSLNNPADIKAPVIAEYLAEKQEAQSGDEGGYVTNVRGGGLSMGFNLSGQMYQGDYGNALAAPAGDVYLRYGFTEIFALQLNANMGMLRNRYNFETSYQLAEMYSVFNLTPEGRLNPYLYLGASLLSYQVDDREGNRILNESRLQPALVSGLGVEMLLSSRIGLTMALDNHYLFSDRLDGVKHGTINDNFWGSRIGFIFYF
jgi:curli production assembly/transport component CsgG